MSKYNTGASIPIGSLSKEELDQAMKEWSHYDLHMERLLRKCMEKGIVTDGCHPEVDPYIDFILGKNIEEEKKLVNSIINIKNTQLHIMPDGGNPFAGPDWDKAIVGIGAYIDNKKDVDDYLDTLTASLDIESPSNSFCFHLLDLAEFLRNKESRLMIRGCHDENDEYSFVIETTALTDNMCKYYKDFLSKSGLTEFEEIPNHRLRFGIKSPDKEFINEKAEELTNYIKSNLNIPDFTNEEELSFNMRARRKRREFGESLEGMKKFKEWLEEEHERIFSSFQKKGK